MEITIEMTKGYAFKNAERFRSWVWINLQAKEGKFRAITAHMARHLKVSPQLVRRHISELAKRGIDISRHHCLEG